jgi:antitoxin component YwqK of YwqJK toxin-antitoxin module
MLNMNKILIILSLVLLASCAPNEVPSKDLVERDGIKYEVNSQTPFTGVSVSYHENGQLMYKGAYKDGNKEGLWMWYHQNGELWSKGNFKDGMFIGNLYESYYDNGQLMSKENYKDGKRDGLYESFQRNGQLETKSCYVNGEETDMSYCEK